MASWNLTVQIISRTTWDYNRRICESAESHPREYCLHRCYRNSINGLLDAFVEYMSEDELLEVTPKSLRIRKKILGTEDRHKAKAAKDKTAAREMEEV